MSVIKSKKDLIFYIACTNSNYNGDPDAGNLPRTDYNDDSGILTDVALKSRIRDFVYTVYGEQEGFDIVIKHGANINRAIFDSVKEVHGGEEVLKNKDFKNTKVAESREILCKRYWDIRAFGGVMSTGLNSGEIQGAVQVNMSNSLDPVEIHDIAITRKAVTDGKDFKTEQEFIDWEKNTPDDKKRTIGRKQFASFALFEVEVHVSVFNAEKSGFTDDDFDKLLQAILNMYSFKPSASKQGMEVVGPIFIFDHVGKDTTTDEKSRLNEMKIGCAPFYKLRQCVDVRKKEEVTYPKSYLDYEAVFHKDKLPNGVRIGFKLDTFSDIEWDNLSDNSWFKVV